jgi:hypothetical protein
MRPFLVGGVVLLLLLVVLVWACALLFGAWGRPK